MWKKVGGLAGAICLLLFSIGPPVWAAEKRLPEEGAAEFEMREVSVFDVAGADAYSLLRGQYAPCSTQRDPRVRAYPAFHAKQPLFGKVVFNRSLDDPKAGLEFQFAFDRAEEAATEKPKPAKEPSLLDKLLGALTGERAEEPKPPAPADRYDRLYFDANRDLDLTNDPVLLPMKSPPEGAVLRVYGSTPQVVFDYLAVEVDYGKPIGKQRVEIMPRLLAREGGGTAYFVNTKAREGKVRFGAREYRALLAQPYLVSGRFDRPYTRLQLTPADSSSRTQRESWWGADEIGALRYIDDTWYTLSATPVGDKLFVRPYQGDLGLFRLGKGTREIDQMSILGSLRSREMVVPLGQPSDKSPMLEKVKECRLPVGDYSMEYVNVEYGRLSMGISKSYHSEGHAMDLERPTVYGIKIRKDQPFVLDFSEKPDVIFTSPTKDRTYRPGEEVSVKAVLVDPSLDIMIRRLYDTGRKEKETYKLADGKERTIERIRSLDPTVVITDSSGKEVDQGKMPFG